MDQITLKKKPRVAVYLRYGTRRFGGILPDDRDAIAAFLEQINGRKVKHESEFNSGKQDESKFTLDDQPGRNLIKPENQASA